MLGVGVGYFLRSTRPGLVGGSSEVSPVSVGARLPRACTVNRVSPVLLPSPVWDTPHPFLPAFLSPRSSTRAPFPESRCLLPRPS